MASFVDILGVVDRSHRPKVGSSDLDRYKEWYHFNILDPANDIDLILNVSLSGEVTRAGGGAAEVIALCRRRAEDWAGGIDSYDGVAVALESEAIGLQVTEACKVEYVDGAYEIQFRRRDGTLEVVAELVPRTEPMLLWNDTPLGSGRLNWLIVPHLEASGSVQLGVERIEFARVCAYHDHNWGFWKWGEDFAWEWGFAADMSARHGEGRISVVFDRTSDQVGAMSLEHTLAIWRDAALVKVFARQMLRSQRRGRFAGDVRRVPGAARLVAQGHVLTVPEEIAISARDESDWLDLVYRVDAALQVTVPREFGFGYVELNETVGVVDVRGMVGGADLMFRARASFEFLG